MHPGGLDTVTCGIQTPLVLLKAGVVCHGITQRNGMVTPPDFFRGQKGASEAVKNSFLLYTDYMEQLELLSLEQRGVLLTAVMLHSMGKDLPEMDAVTKMAFSFIRADLDRATKKYDDTVSKRKAAGKAGGEAKADKSKQLLANVANAKFARNDVANVANASFATNGLANAVDNDNDNENVNDNNNPPYPPLPGGGVRKDPMEERFERFWSAYPKKTGKGDARKSFLKIKPSSALLERMLSALAAASASYQWQRDKGRFIPNPSTWLNQQRWEDEVRPDMGKPDPKQAPQSRFHNLEQRPADDIDQEAIAQMKARILGKGAP